MADVLLKTTQTTKTTLRGWLRGFCCLCCLSGLLFSCSEASGTEDEYANWQTQNDELTDSWAASSAYQKILSYSKESSSPTLVNSDYIYVEVLESGNLTEGSPLYTDTCRVAYRGRLMPTSSYPDGLVFDQSYLNDFSWETMGVTDFAALAVVNGFGTALMNMHVGDRWRVHIPYQLGYGSSSSGSVRAYSNLIFDIALVDFWSPGDSRPTFKSRHP